MALKNDLSLPRPMPAPTTQPALGPGRAAAGRAPAAPPAASGPAAAAEHFSRGPAPAGRPAAQAAPMAGALSAPGTGSLAEHARVLAAATKVRAQTAPISTVASSVAGVSTLGAMGTLGAVGLGVVGLGAVAPAVAGAVMLGGGARMLARLAARRRTGGDEALRDDVHNLRETRDRLRQQGSLSQLETATLQAAEDGLRGLGR